MSPLVMIILPSRSLSVLLASIVNWRGTDAKARESLLYLIQSGVVISNSTLVSILNSRVVFCPDTIYLSLAIKIPSFWIWVILNAVEIPSDTIRITASLLS